MKQFQICLLAGILVLMISALGCEKEDPVEIPEVKTLPVTDIGAGTAKSGGDVTDDGGAPVIVRGVVWDTTDNPDVRENKGMTADGEDLGEYASNMTGLSPETEYYVKAYATNIEGTAYGEEKSFTTLAGLTDIDGNVYNVDTLGQKIFMSENLRTTRYNDGTEIPLVTGDSEWSDLFDGAYSFYQNDEDFKDAYGLLYNWHAVETGKLCPQGWKVPEDDDFKLIESIIGMSPEEYDNTGWRGTDEGGILKSTRTYPDDHPRWDSPNTGATNESRFSGLPGGGRDMSGVFQDIGSGGGWWSATKGNHFDVAWVRILYHDETKVLRGEFNTKTGLSVRCVKGGS